MAFESDTAGSVGTMSGGMVGPDGQLNVDTGMENGFLGSHTPEGIYSSLKGQMLSPYELDGIESTSAHGGSLRGYAPSPDGQAPSETIDVNTPMTMGGGSFAR